MIPFLLLSIAIAVPFGIPSSVRETCDRDSQLIYEIKLLQISGLEPPEIIEWLDNEGYNIEGHEEILGQIIKSTFEEMATPESIKRADYEECLKLYKSK